MAVGIPVGSLDMLITVMGVRGQGKSTWATAELWRQGRALGGYMIAHSPGRRLPTHLPPEMTGSDSWLEIPLEYHSTIERLEERLRDRPDAIHVIDNAERVPIEDLIAWARKLAAACIERAKREQPEEPVPVCPPVLLLIDEGSELANETGGSKKPSREMFRFLTGLRHEHVGVIWNVQSGSIAHWQWIGQSTDVIVFRLRHRYDLDVLRTIGAEDVEIEQARRLPRYRYLRLAVHSATE